MTEQAENEKAGRSAGRRGWESDDPSNELLGKYREELIAFRKWANDEDACRDHLIACLGWKDNGKNSEFKCPSCGNRSASSRLKTEGKGETRKERLVFECKKCGQTPSPKSVTIMKRSSIPLGFWFLCLLVIGLMNGRVPWNYLDRQRQKFKSKDKPVSVAARDLERLVLKILAISDVPNLRVSYAQMAKMVSMHEEPLKSYSTWYKTKSWIPWRIAFKKDPYTLKMILNSIDKLDRLDIVKDVYVCNDHKLYVGEWLLIASINNEDIIKNIEWFCVSEIVKIGSQSKGIDEYTTVAIFYEQDRLKNYPFVVGSRFNNALNKQVGSEILTSLSLNSVKILPNTIFKKIADGFLS